MVDNNGKMTIREPYKDYPVLYVDDEIKALKTFQAQYEEDFTIYTAQNGEEALRLLRANPKIAVIISDERMPGMTGLELLEQVQILAGPVVRILITAYTDIDLVIKAINRGNVYRYVTKPYKEEELRIAINHAIERYYLVQERDRLHAEKIETLKRVARANRLSAIGTLAAGMAHEINNPLVAINTFLQMLPQNLKGVLNERMTEFQWDPEYWESFYRLSLKETERIKKLIGRLRDYSKSGGDEDLYLRESNVNSLIEEIVMLLKNEAKKKEIRFDLQLKPILPKVKVDQEKIRQVILNLILNAIDATPPGGVITFTTSAHPDADRPEYFEIKVIDRGVGISDKDLEQLFDPFFTTKGPEGTGLGLMTCHHIIDQHRGKIDIRSKLGIGTTVVIQIPMDAETHDRRNVERRADPEGINEGE